MNKLLKMPVLLLILGGVIMFASAAGVATLSVSTISTSASLTNEALASDATVSVTNAALSQTGSIISAAGTSSSASVEATTGLATTTPGMSANYWLYQAEVKEAAASSWGSAACYKAEVFADGAIVGTTYFKNSTVDNANVEGVTVKVGLAASNSSSVPGNLTTKVTAITSCS